MLDDEKECKNTWDIDYEAQFRIQLERWLPQVLDKLVKEDKGNIRSIIKKMIEEK